jgi:molecular chaperone HtpG
MVKGSLEIHSENILPIIKKWLYSDRDIFVRELVSNACDAIHKVSILSDRGETESVDADFRVDVAIDKEKKTLTFTDNGIGMDADEVKKYIAQIAFSGAEEFVEKYKSHSEKDQFIGHFGLGFYSAYMVADKVEINTLSYKPGSKPVLWSCDGSSDYEIGEGTRSTRGTEITLFINKENEEYLEESRLREILKQYCSYLVYPIYLNGQRINTQDPLWIKNPSECTEKDYLDFYRHLYPMDEEPLFWVHLNVDYPFHLKGILYFPKMRRDFDIKKSTIKLFCNRVFVSDNCKDILPEYLTVLRGVIDSPDIPLNVSRSTLQMDRTVRQLSTHISKKVSDSLSTVYKTDRERYIRCWDDIQTVIKLGSVQDDKFYDRVKDLIIWKMVGGEWRTVQEYLEINKEKTKDKVLYTTDEKHHRQVLDVYAQKKIEVLVASHPIDSYVINTMEQKIKPASFQRVDGGIDDELIDKSREKTILDTEGKTEAGRLADFVRQKMDDANIEVEAKSLATDELPGMIVMDENQRRLRDYMMQIDPTNAHAFTQSQKRTFVVNTNNPLMASLNALSVNHPELAQEMVKEVFELSLLSQREMDQNALHTFVIRTNKVLEQLVKLAVK